MSLRVVVVFGAFFLCAVKISIAQQRERDNPCVIPTRRDATWLSWHNRYVAEAKQRECEVMFIGDSIVYQMQSSSLWKDKISSLQPLNFGIGGDRVENVLWRVQNGALDFRSEVNAIVVFVGTNNRDCTPREIYEGILEVIKTIQEKLDDVHILLPTLLPRGKHPNADRERNNQVNNLLIDKFKNNDDDDDDDQICGNVHVICIHENIVGADQTIPSDIMPDYLHLSNDGYTKIFTPVYEKLRELLR